MLLDWTKSCTVHATCREKFSNSQPFALNLTKEEHRYVLVTRVKKMSVAYVREKFNQHFFSSVFINDYVHVYM